MVRRTKAEAEATRENILDAAEHVFLERGVARTSLEEIARAAGVTRGAVYWHFKNKVDLFNGMIERVRLPLSQLIESLEMETGRDPIATIRAALLHVLRKLTGNEQYRRVFTIYYHRLESVDEFSANVRQQNVLARECKKVFGELFERAERLNLLRPGVLPAQAAIAVHVYIIGIFSDWLRDPEAYDLAQNAEALVDMLMQGLVRPAAEYDPA